MSLNGAVTLRLLLAPCAVIVQIPSVFAAGVNSTVLSIVYHNTGRDFWVAYANGLDPAQNQDYVHVELSPSP